MFLGIARNADPAKARAMAQQLIRMPASAATKEQAQLIIDRLDMPGKMVAFEWQDELGKSHRLADFLGSVVVFYVWATWTPASEAAVPKIKSLVPASAVLVSVNVDKNVDAGKNAGRKSGLGGIAYYDQRGIDGPLPKQLRANQVPAVHVVDARGKYVGTGGPEALAALLQAAGK
jgi:hypothetical protein